MVKWVWFAPFFFFKKQLNNGNGCSSSNNAPPTTTYNLGIWEKKKISQNISQLQCVWNQCLINVHSVHKIFHSKIKYADVLMNIDYARVSRHLRQNQTMFFPFEQNFSVHFRFCLKMQLIHTRAFTIHIKIHDYISESIIITNKWFSSNNEILHQHSSSSAVLWFPDDFYQS